jgi:hypothetical protein
MISALPQPSAVARMICPPHVLLRRAAVRDERLKSMADRAGDVQENSRSQAERLNSFGRFGNRPDGADH